MNAFAFPTQSFTPLAFRPSVERAVVATLGVAAGVLWLLVLPAEIALRLVV